MSSGKDNKGSLPGRISSTLPFCTLVSYCLYLVINIALHGNIPALPGGRSFVAIACSEGIWVTDSHDPDCIFPFFLESAPFLHLT